MVSLLVRFRADEYLMRFGGELAAGGLVCPVSIARCGLSRGRPLGLFPSGRFLAPSACPSSSPLPSPLSRSFHFHQDPRFLPLSHARRRQM